MRSCSVNVLILLCSQKSTKLVVTPIFKPTYAVAAEVDSFVVGAHFYTAVPISRLFSCVIKESWSGVRGLATFSLIEMVYMVL